MATANISLGAVLFTPWKTVSQCTIRKACRNKESNPLHPLRHVMGHLEMGACVANGFRKYTTLEIYHLGNMPPWKYTSLEIMACKTPARRWCQGSTASGKQGREATSPASTRSLALIIVDNGIATFPFRRGR
ncbi:hypothetical protein TCAP_07006 [Tolypocladium capitatum]|uniref:Uncharacterized protein n=1 Tax=Tolypocladium capitatum TaxID=45235 RepID=A0A2K3Q622_9HYPO|nr:hypothetical protein TCAP_07006 [Tolypocladium capitatum]